MNLSGTEYFRQKFSKLSLDQEVLQNKVFEECHFESCSFMECKFEKCRFMNCAFKDSLLNAVLPMECKFLEVAFQGCKVNAIDWTKSLEIRDLHFLRMPGQLLQFSLPQTARFKISPLPGP